jgi:NADPH:quinone reductase-like Zn-dependent oxidoreductase
MAWRASGATMSRAASRREKSHFSRTNRARNGAPSNHIDGYAAGGCGPPAAQEFVDIDNDVLEDVGEVDLVFDVIGGDIAKRSAGVIRTGGTLVTITGPTEARPTHGLTIDFVAEPDRAQLSEVVQRIRNGRLRANIGKVATLDDAVAAFNRTERIKGKTIIRVRP